MHLPLLILTLLLALATEPTPTRADDAASAIDRRARQAEPHVIALRRKLHQHPELSNREVATAELIASQLKQLGLTVRTGIAHTGVSAMLRGAKPGPVVALRADMDALPVTEQLNLPFASKVRAEYQGQPTGVMHACGHDAHMAILLGVAEVLAGMKSALAGSVQFIFQPAEEGPPPGEKGGARLMLEQGVFSQPLPGAIFGLHVWTQQSGTLLYRSGPSMAVSDRLRIVVTGKQTHGAQPWTGVDPIVVASQIVLGLQTLISRQVDLTVAPAVVTVGSIHGGNRGNIIPESVTLEGTIRSFDKQVRDELHARTRRTADLVASSAGARAETEISAVNPGVNNDPQLTAQMLPTLQRVAGSENVRTAQLVTGSEDFGEYQQRVPGLFVFLGVVPKGQDVKTAAHNHSPLFFVDESALQLGVRTLANLAVDWLQQHASPARN